MQANIDEIKQFLLCSTPIEWIENALQNQDILLIDHAHCEKKAASTALSLIYRYPDREQLLQKLSRLAREELRHFEKVLTIMKSRNISFCHLEPGRYAGELHRHARTYEPAKLVDTLIIGAFIEARSCERFAALAPLLDPELQKFYFSLLQSESRHYQDYLQLARKYADQNITERINLFAQKEAELIMQPDSIFRFHSGIPS
jgi:tRNA-(ms[2]io[6]A)-hydroxylase